MTALSPPAGLPGPRVFGFLGCSAVVRRSAYLEVGGYHKLLGTGGEEELLALDLAAAGWALAYVDRMTARHFPSRARDAAARQATEQRNRVLVAWLRRPIGRALALTAALGARACRDPVARHALAALLAVLPQALPARRPLPARIEAELRVLNQAGGGQPGR